MDYDVFVMPDAKEDLEGFMLFRIEGNQVIIDSIFHELQDYERKMF